MYTALIDPPYELAPYMPAVVALQLELFTLLIDTFTPLAVVNPDLLLLLLLKLKLLAYPPMYTENEPPYELAPNMPAVVALQEVNDAVPTRTLALRTAVSPTAATASP